MVAIEDGDDVQEEPIRQELSAALEVAEDLSSHIIGADLQQPVTVLQFDTWLR